MKSAKMISQTMLPWQQVAWVAGILLAIFATASVSTAQTTAGFKVDVRVTDQGQAQRKSAYWLALDKLIRRDLPVDFLDDTQRQEVLRDAAKYVQSFRYRAILPEQDARRLSTRQVREGAEPNSVIEVSFPAGLAGIIEEQLAPVAVLTEVTEDSGNGGVALALVAVDQDGTQFMIGGPRGKKFQSRMLQLGAVNALSLQFPEMDTQDLESLSPTDVLYNQADRLTPIMEKYAADSRVTGALFRLSADAWQSEWRYVVPGQPERTVNLTTRTLDEALITAISELANNSDSRFTDAGSYFDNSGAFQRTGLGVRVENVNDLADYHYVLATLRSIDESIVTEVLDTDAMTFRASGITAESLQSSLLKKTEFSSLPLDPAVGEGIGIRVRFR